MTVLQLLDEMKQLSRHIQALLQLRMSSLLLCGWWSWMYFNMPLLQGAEQAQSPEVVVKERMHRLSKNSVRELFSPSPGSCSCLCDLHGQFSQLHVQTRFVCKFYMRFHSWTVTKTLHTANCRQISPGLSNVSCADSQASQCAAFPTFTC